MLKVLSTLVLVSSLLLSSCTSDKKTSEFEWKVYKASLEHGDVGTAINSLNRILTIDKYNADALDTLALLYLASNMNEAAAKIAFRALNVRQSDSLLATLAKANKAIGNNEVALENYLKLLEKSPENLEWLYETAYAYINTGNLKASLPLINRIIAHPDSESQVMQEFIKEGSQVIPYKAVAYNMLGFLQSKAGKPLDAIQSYESALKIFPDYYLAGNNLKLSREAQVKGN